MKQAYGKTKGTAYNTNVLPDSDNETKEGSNNNLFQGPAEKTVSNDNLADGMGLARPSTLKSFEEFPGSEASEWAKLKDREFARYDDLKKAMGRNIPITNAGIELNAFGGAYSEEERRGEQRQDREDREQQRSRPASQE